MSPTLSRGSSSCSMTGQAPQRMSTRLAASCLLGRTMSSRYRELNFVTGFILTDKPRPLAHKRYLSCVVWTYVRYRIAIYVPTIVQTCGRHSLICLDGKPVVRACVAVRLPLLASSPDVFVLFAHKPRPLGNEIGISVCGKGVAKCMRFFVFLVFCCFGRWADWRVYDVLRVRPCVCEYITTFSTFSAENCCRRSATTCLDNLIHNFRLDFDSTPCETPCLDILRLWQRHF